MRRFATIYKYLKIFTISLIVLFALVMLYALMIKGDRAYGKKLNKRELAFVNYSSLIDSNGNITISKGDIIFKVSLFYFAHSNKPYLGCIPGHLGLCMTDTTLPYPITSLDNIVVAEASLFNINKKIIEPKVKIGDSKNNYSYAAGRLYLLKNYLTAAQKELLEQFIESRRELPYKLFAGKSDTTNYNCATFVWQAIKFAQGRDIDFDGGSVVLPADILRYYTSPR